MEEILYDKAAFGICPSGIYAMNTVYIPFITPESTGSDVRALAQARAGRRRTLTHKRELEGQLV